MLEQQQKKMFKFVAAKSTCMQDGQQMHLSKVAKKQNIDIGQVNDYSSFFNFIISECPTEELAYISWVAHQIKRHCVLLSSINGKFSKKNSGMIQ